MKKVVFISILCLFVEMVSAQLPMGGWQMHYAYNRVEQIEQSESRVYALAAGALFSVDKKDDEISCYSKLTGLNGNTIKQIKYAPALHALLIAYTDGNIDMLYENGEVDNIADLYITQSNINKEAEDIIVHGEQAYFAMNFGIVALNLKRKEITDTYYIGENAEAVSLHAVTILADSLYAASDDAVYTASLSDNLVDFSFWNKNTDIPGSGDIRKIASLGEHFFLLRDSTLYLYEGKKWKSILTDVKISNIHQEEKQLLATSSGSNYAIHSDLSVDTINIFYGSTDLVYDNGSQTYWLAYFDMGIAKYMLQNGKYDMFRPSGPAENRPYRMRVFDETLYVVPGGRWGVQYGRQGVVMIYKDRQWTNIDSHQIVEKTGKVALDFMNVAVDPLDADHFYVTSYGTGLYEFKGTDLVRRLTAEDTPISSPNTTYDLYTRLDGAVFDKDGNLWFASAGGKEADLYVMTPAGAITALMLKNENGYHVPLYTPQEILIDSRYPNYKWVAMARSTPAFILYDDGGTPTNPYDDRNYIRTTFHDQRGAEVAPDSYFCYAQDLNGDIWIGTEDGPIIVNSTTDFRTSDLCERMIIYRTDGSSLGDYLLKGERINAIAVDGANRKWIGTENSGVYLLEEVTNENSARTIETIHHFTTENSPLPSDNILSIAIDQKSGEVFIGTVAGLLSYQSDAAESSEDLSSVYAYPNPVREDFEGLVTITGLMDNTTVNITDVNGNLVAQTYSLGGLATWDIRNGQGVRVRTGVYMAQCVAATGAHALVKILVIN